MVETFPYRTSNCFKNTYSSDESLHIIFLSHFCTENNNFIFIYLTETAERQPSISKQLG